MELFNVIKYEGNNDTFVWKHPAEDFNIGSTIIVHESQEAIFFKDGQALDLFGPGKHSLTTENLPILNKIINIPTDGVSPFHCEVYFINKADHMAIKWGTDNKVQYIDPKYNFPLSLGASGEMIVSVNDSRKLLVKMVGTEAILTRDGLINNFRAFLLTRIKNYLVNTIIEKKIGIFEIDSYLSLVSESLKQLLLDDFNNYGLNLDNFFVTSFVKPEDDEYYHRLKKIHADQAMSVQEARIRQDVSVIDQETEAKKTIIEAEAMAGKRKIEGYTYQEEQGFEVAKNLANNEGVGNFTSAGIGVGIMAGVGNTMGNTFTNALNPNTNTIPNEDVKFCIKCGSKLPSDALFCSRCGAKL